MTNVSGMLGLTTPRDAFFNSLSKFSVPIRVVSSLEAWVEHPPSQTPRSATAAFSEGLGLGGPTQPPGLSERNMACLKVLLGCSLFLAGSLGESWYAVLEALQNADGVLAMMAKTGGGHGSTKKGIFGGGANVPSGMSGGPPNMRSASLSGTQSVPGATAAPSKHPLLSDLDVETMQLAIQRLFDSSKNLEDSAFRDFVNALCKLSSEMVGMQTSEVIPVNPSESSEDTPPFLSVAGRNRSSESVVHRRRVSGIQIPKNFVSCQFICSIWIIGLCPPCSEGRRFRYLQTGRRCNAQYTPSHLPVARYCMEYDDEPLTSDYPPWFRSSSHPNSGWKGVR